MEYVSPKGVKRDFELSVDRILEMEEADPGFSLVNEFRKLTTTYRVTYADHLCRALGTTYKDFVRDGFYMEDLADIMTKALGDLHFFKPSPTNSEDLPQASS